MVFDFRKQSKFFPGRLDFFFAAFFWNNLLKMLNAQLYIFFVFTFLIFWHFCLSCFVMWKSGNWGDMKSDIFHGQMEESSGMIWFLTKYFMPVETIIFHCIPFYFIWYLSLDFWQSILCLSTPSYFMLNWGSKVEKDQ